MNVPYCRLTARRSHLLRCGAAIYSLADSLPSSQQSVTNLSEQARKVGQAFLPVFLRLSESANTPDKNVCPTSLLHTQGDDGIHARRAARRNVASHERSQAEHERYSNVGQRIRWRYFKEQLLQEAREPQRSEQAERDADQSQRHALPQNHAQDFSWTRADGHAHADLVPPLADRQGHHATDARGRNRPRQ